MTFIDEDAKTTLGFLDVLEKLQILSPYGKVLADNLQPITSMCALQNEFDNMQFLLASYISNQDLFKDIEGILTKFKNITNSLNRSEREYILDEVELYEIKNFAILAGELGNQYAKLTLNIPEIQFININDIVGLLNLENNIISTFCVYDQYSKELQEIRAEKRKIEKEILVVKDSEKLAALKENRLEVVLREQSEELQIKRRLSAEIGKAARRIRQNTEAVAHLDFILSKVRLARDNNLCRPVIVQESKINMIDGIYPGVDNFTPISVELPKGVSILTGANMGGKSVTLKLIALNTLLAQMGFYVFAREFIFSIQHFIFYVSADMQSLSRGLSTFGAEIIKMNEIIASAREQKGLIILDEFARGTNPFEGSKLVRALARYLNTMDSISFIATHYDGIAGHDLVHYEVIGLRSVDWESIDLNKHSSFDMQSLMDYRLCLVGGIEEVPRDAINICRLLGLDKTIIEWALEQYDN